MKRRVNEEQRTDGIENDYSFLTYTKATINAEENFKMDALNFKALDVTVKNF